MVQPRERPRQRDTESERARERQRAINPDVIDSSHADLDQDVDWTQATIQLRAGQPSEHGQAVLAREGRDSGGPDPIDLQREATCRRPHIVPLQRRPGRNHSHGTAVARRLAVGGCCSLGFRERTCSLGRTRNFTSSGRSAFLFERGLLLRGTLHQYEQGQVGCTLGLGRAFYFVFLGRPPLHFCRLGTQFWREAVREPYGAEQQL